MSEATAGTVRLYHGDSLLLAFDARVLSNQPRGERQAVVLDRTAFYPESGGQPADRGVLAGRAVLDVIEEGDLVVHLMDGPLTALEVHGEVDATRRFDHMQQHTGQHILSQAFIATCGRETLSFHLGEQRATIEVAGALSAEMIRETEKLANHVVFEDRPVRVLALSAEEAAARGARKIPERRGTLRVIEVEGFDVSPCGGTHVARAGSVGLIKTLGGERIRGNTRLEFVCGARALADYGSRVDLVTALAASFTSGEAEIPAAIERVREEARQARREIEELRHALAEHTTRALEAGFAPFGEAQLLSHVFNPDEAASMGECARRLTDGPGRIVLFAESAGGKILFARSKEGTPAVDLGAILREAAAEAGGKGGGRPQQAQGSVPRAEDARHVVEAAERLLREASR